MKGENIAVLALFTFLLGVSFVILVMTVAGVGDAPEDKYTVQELTAAIATREADFAERAIELEGEK